METPPTDAAAGAASRAAASADGRPGWLATVAIIWGGQFISLVGSAFTRFAFGVWVYRETGSVAEFALIALFGGLPGLLLAPLAGALVDRWSRRAVMQAANTVAAAASLLLGLLVWGGELAIWQVYLYVGLGSVLQAFHWPAYTAATTLLAPKRHLARLSGLAQLGLAGAGALAPLPAGLLLASIGILGIIVIDFLTFAFAAITVTAVRIPELSRSGAGSQARSPLVKEALFGWTFIRERPGLMGLLLYFAVVNLALTMELVLVSPLVLAFASAQALGLVLSVGNAGLVAGSLILSVHGGPRRRIHGVLGLGLLLGASMLLLGLRASPPWIAGTLFLGLFTIPFINGCSQAIWQTKVPPELQGRVFAIRRLIAQATVPVAQLAAGPLADFVFEPAMAEGGALAGTLGPILGAGPGRGIGLLLMALAIPTLLSTLWGYANIRLRRVEDELPEAVEESSRGEPASPG